MVLEQSQPHPLVVQLRFTRSEFVRSLEGVSDVEAQRRFEPMNCISWIVGHLAYQEHAYWASTAQNLQVAPELRDLVGFGRPASTPPLDEMWHAWRAVTNAADRYLDMLTTATLQTFLQRKGKSLPESVGTMLLRNTHHYWFHMGEAYAIRQMLGHTGLPEFVGPMDLATYRPEIAE